MFLMLKDLGKSDLGIYVSRLKLDNKIVFSTYYGNDVEGRWEHDKFMLKKHGAIDEDILDLQMRAIQKGNLDDRNPLREM